MGITPFVSRECMFIRFVLEQIISGYLGLKTVFLVCVTHSDIARFTKSSTTDDYSIINHLYTRALSQAEVA